MTVAIVVKVYDGIVLAADSATTLGLQNGKDQVYNGANKVFHLHRGLPIGAMTWGLGQLGSASIATVIKDLRRRFMGHDRAHLDWELDPASYTVEAVAARLAELLFGELYSPLSTTGALGLVVAGYSSGETSSEAWLVNMDDPNVDCVPVLAAGKDESGWIAYAQPEGVHRLFNGFDPAVPAMLAPIIEQSKAAQIPGLLEPLTRQPANPAMPFGDAIQLAGFMVDVTVGYTRYLLGPDTVGGPVDVAGITRHEGFKWVQRKHYYPSDLNPGRPHDHDHE